ncbi:MAG: glycosyltransferase family 39 protein [Anaerolineales bacterium]|nr:glycosyltransferase family 39 protein [Anaerolineales bacterium]
MMKQNHWRTWIFALLLLIVITPSHIIQNDQTITIDEPWWMISGSNYYYALTHRDFENTRYDYHPAVTTTWMVTAGMFSYFPEYRGLGQGYFDVRKTNYEEFLRAQEKDVLTILRNGRYVQTAVILFFAVIAFYFLQLIVGYSIAFLSVSLAMLAPFFLGHARLFNHEGMLAIFVLVSFLAIYVYLHKERKLIYLLISGASFGLAQLTKSSSIVLIGVIGLMLLIQLIRKDENPLRSKLIFVSKTLGIWFISAALTYFILWPGMWVAPTKMLSEVYGNAFSYAFQGARLEAIDEIEQAPPAEFNIASRLAGIRLYITYWLSGTTFITWLGIIFAGFLFFSKSKIENIKSLVFYLLILGSLFILMFGIVQGRNYAHYITSAFLAFDIIAGIGWGFAWMYTQNKWQILNKTYANVTFIIALVLTQIGFGLPYAPYYFTYKNPLAKQPATFGYGEGYDQAAEYLINKPNASQMRVYVYNGMGTFSYLFVGETLVFKRVYLVDESYEQIVEEMKSSDYLVLYPIIREKQPETEKLFNAFENVTPEKTILINSMDYVYIYNVSEIPESVYEALLK